MRSSGNLGLLPSAEGVLLVVTHVRGDIAPDVRGWDGILLSDVGTSRQRVSSGTLGDLSVIEGGYVHTLIIPSNMSDNEKDAFHRRKES